MAFTNRNTERVAVMTTDGKFFVGTLEGYDHSINVILTDTEERLIVRSDEGDSLVEKLGVYVIRGDLVCCVGLVDEEVDSQVDWAKVHGEPLAKTKKTIK